MVAMREKALELPTLTASLRNMKKTWSADGIAEIPRVQQHVVHTVMTNRMQSADYDVQTSLTRVWVGALQTFDVL
jgi:hypothetical protein